MEIKHGQGILLKKTTHFLENRPRRENWTESLMKILSQDDPQRNHMVPLSRFYITHRS